MTKEHEFKQRLTAVLKDLQEDGIRDPQAMWLLGSLASDLATDLGAADWSEVKRNADTQTYDTLLRTFEQQGNEHHREGRGRHAYAIQMLAVSLIARTQVLDPQVAEGAQLLDQLIDRAVIIYRQDRDQTSH